MSPAAITVAAVGSLLASVAVARDNGYGRTPMLGYNTYNDVVCGPTTSQVESTMDALKSKGLLAAGYSMFQIDCGWQGYDRQSNGSITYDSTNFPTGIKPLSDRARSMGFRWGMYTDQGVYACDTSSRRRPGSLGYEKQDALMFAAWNAEYVKVDNCWITPDANAPKDPRDDFVTRYSAMSSALDGVGIKGMLVCQWGVPFISANKTLQGPAQWTPSLATSYRVSDDIAQGWANVQRIMNEAINVNLRGLSKPGSFADMDLLEVGNAGMTVAEQQSHFAIWAAFKSALMISTNVPNMSSATLQILSNKGLLQVNQDSLGVPATLVQRYTNNYDLFAGPLAGGDKVVLLVEQGNQAKTLSVDFAQLGVSSATVTNLWTGQSTTGATSYSAAVDAHGSIALRLSNVQRASTSAPTVTYYEAEAGRLAGGAVVQSCSGCSGGKNVGYLGGDGTLTLTGVRASSTTVNVRFDYVNCEIGYLSGGTNTRIASVSVNGGAAQTVEFPISGYNWDADVQRSFLARLDGFVKGASNTVVIRGASSGGYAPDIDRVGFV